MTTAVQLAPAPVFKAFDNNGFPLFNGLLYTYVAGSSTPQATYVDYTGTTPNTNPVVLNARGEANVWLAQGLTYKLTLTDALGNQIWSIDQIYGGQVVTAATVGQLIYPQTAQEITAGVTPASYMFAPGDVRRYGADPTGATDSTPAWQNALLSNSVVFDSYPGNSVYLISSTLVQQFVGQKIIGNGWGDSNSTVYGNQFAARTELRWNGAAGGVMWTSYNANAVYQSTTGIHLSEGSIQSIQFNGNNLAGVGIQAYKNIVTTGVFRQTFTNVSVINVNNSTQVVTLASSPAANAITGALASAWAGQSQVFPVTFSTGDVRIVVFINGQTSISWDVGLTASPTTSATIHQGTGFYFGTGTGNANSNDSRLENCYVNNCDIGYTSGGATVGGKSTTFNSCKLGFSATNGADVVLTHCIFFGNTVDVSGYNFSFQDFGSTYQNSTLGIFQPWAACTSSFIGSQLATSFTTVVGGTTPFLISYNSAAGNHSALNCQVPGPTTLFTGMNATGYSYDFSLTNCALPASFLYKRRIAGAYALEQVDNAKLNFGLTATSSNVTGDGTQVNAFAGGVTVEYDLSSLVTAASGTVTAPCTGWYEIGAYLALTGILSTHNDAQLLVVFTGTAAGSRMLARINPYNSLIAGTTEADLGGVMQVKMSQGDTFTIQLVVAGGTKVVGVYSGGSISLLWRSRCWARLV